MKIEILGPGCSKCKTLAENARAAAEQIGIECEIVKVTEIAEIMKRGVMLTPALVIDGEVKTSGRVLSPEKIRELLQP